MATPVVVCAAAAAACTTVADRDAILQQFRPEERELVRRMKRKERQGILSLLAAHAKKHSSVVHQPLRMRVLQSQLPQELRVQLFEELGRGVSDKYEQWIRAALRLPLETVRSPVFLGSPREVLERTRALLDARMHGHEAVKLEVLKMVCQTKAGGVGTSRYALGLEGPPGTGKTYFARHALADALDRPVVTIPLGGAMDVNFLLGNLYTYEGSKEGRLATALVEARCCNPILFFDEVDKISTTDRGAELASVLIHLVDPSCNAALRDRYFHGIDIDYSRCTFVFSYNDPARVHPVLLDRITRVRMDPPTRAQRMAIVKDHLVSRTLARIGSDRLSLSDDAVTVIVDASDQGGGLRASERAVEQVLTSAQLAAAQRDAAADTVVSGAFARTCLPPPSPSPSSGPPSLMYA